MKLCEEDKEMKEFDEMCKLSSMHHEIDRLLDELKDKYSCYSVGDRDTFRQYMEERLEEEFPHPHYDDWIHEGNGPWNNAIVCRECGFKIRIPESYTEVYRYCPVCGTSHGKIVEEGDKNDET